MHVCCPTGVSCLISTNKCSPLLGRWVTIVQMDIVPSDFHSCNIILSNDSGGLLRLSDAAEERQQQKKCRSHRSQLHRVPGQRLSRLWCSSCGLKYLKDWGWGEEKEKGSWSCTWGRVVVRHWDCARLYCMCARACLCVCVSLIQNTKHIYINTNTHMKSNSFKHEKLLLCLICFKQ